MLLEIDTRTILGNGGEVSLWIADGGYAVTVNDAAGDHIAGITTDDRKEARDAFLHTFARPDVPDVFARSHDDPA